MAAKHSVHESNVGCKDYSDHYPQSILSMGNAKVLIGPDGAITNQEISMAVMEIYPGRTYPLHNHDAPEVYFVLEGTAKCTWGDDEFQVKPGSAIQTRPGTPHRIEVIGEEIFRAIAFWWAPGGNTEILNCKLNLLEGSEAEQSDL
jgi:mannose-6-phosphate isomerase-like protein (cupin superfamily)